MVDREWQAVFNWLDAGNRKDVVAGAVRDAIDTVLDGLRTGRYRIEQLEKVEKTFLGTKVEQCILFRLKLPKNPQGHLDTTIAGIEVDIKFSITGQWMIPVEAVGKICILVSGDDNSSKFSLGVVRVHDSMLTAGGNRDQKRSLLAAAKKNLVKWVVRNGSFPANFFVQTSPDHIRAIFALPTGQQRVLELFRRIQGRHVTRTVLETVAQQPGSRERARDAKFVLQAEGIRIFTSRDNRELATLGRPKLPRGVWIAIKCSSTEGNVAVSTDTT